MNQHSSPIRDTHKAAEPKAPASLQRACACGNHTLVGECGYCAQEGSMGRGEKRKGNRRAEEPGGGGSNPLSLLPHPLIEPVIHAPGHPLDPSTRGDLERRLGQDLSQVRVHTGPGAAASAQALSARAYTLGRHVVFNHGEYAPHTPDGRRLLAHESTHVAQGRSLRWENHAQVEIGAENSPAEREARGLLHPPQVSLARPTLLRQPAGGITCSLRRPEDCPSYEDWLGQFANLPTFSARDTSATGVNPSGHQVIGGGPAAHFGQPATTAPGAPAPAVGSTRAERFIDHPTDDWVQANLPEELRATAYQLPADCADIAVILRHVWLFYHRRSETYNGWEVGFHAGETARGRQQRVGGVIRGRGSIVSKNAAQIVNPYTDSTGQPIRTFAALANLLHPGDILVWAHHANGLDRPRTGGHVQTISAIRRSGGQVTSLLLLQGNQPVFAGQAQEIRAADPRGPGEGELRDAPGRRIETNTLSGSELSDVQVTVRRGQTESVWTWNDPDHTTLVAAGPPRAAARPAVRRPRGGTQPQRSLNDWLPAVRRARLAQLAGVFEAAILELRGDLEGGRTVTAADAQTLGEAVRQRLFEQARRSRQRGGEDFFRPLSQMRALLRSVQRDTRAAQAAAIFNALERGLSPSSHGEPTDWLGTLRRAEPAALPEVFEAALLDLRASLEGGGTVTEASARDLGAAAGQRLWDQARAAVTARRSQELGAEAHFWPLVQMRATLNEIRASVPAAARGRVFEAIESGLVAAARGESSINFQRPLPRRTSQTTRVLLAGFDPFERSGAQRLPAREEWNPSGAAVLALDGTNIPDPDRAGSVVMVEGVVLPVSFQEFNTGIVERIVAAHRQEVDAIITVSLDPNRATSQPVAIERFVVGTREEEQQVTVQTSTGPRQATRTRLNPVPPAPGEPAGAAIIETGAPVDRLSADPILQGETPEIRDTVTLQFLSLAAAQQAHRDLGLAGQPPASPELEVTRAVAVRDIMRTMQPVSPREPNRIRFTVRGRTYTVVVVSGPGGNFLSNEISYRVQRELGRTPGGPTSFHIHTPNVEPVPTEGPRRAGILARAVAARDRLVATLRRIVVALARQIHRP